VAVLLLKTTISSFTNNKHGTHPSQPQGQAYNLSYTMAILEFNVHRTTKLVMAMVYKKFRSAVNITKEE
jgi:hypothetical protein